MNGFGWVVAIVAVFILGAVMISGAGSKRGDE
jgi:hypothetical protein